MCAEREVRGSGLIFQIAVVRPRRGQTEFAADSPNSSRDWPRGRQVGSREVQRKIASQPIWGRTSAFGNASGASKDLAGTAHMAGLLTSSTFTTSHIHLETRRHLGPRPRNRHPASSIHRSSNRKPTVRRLKFASRSFPAQPQNILGSVTARAAGGGVLGRLAG